MLLISQCHPDTCKTGKIDTTRFQNIVESYRVLCKGNPHIYATHVEDVLHTSPKYDHPFRERNNTHYKM